MTHRANDALALPILGALFAFSAGPVGLVVQKYLVTSYAPPVIVLIQMTLGALVLWMARSFFPKVPLPLSAYAKGLALGAVQPGLLMIILTSAGARLDSVTFVLLAALMPGAVAVMGRLFLKEKLSVWVLIGLLVSFAGMVVLVIVRERTGDNQPLGFALAGLGLLIGAGGITIGRAINTSATMPWFVLAPLQVTGACLAAWAVVLVLGMDLPTTVAPREIIAFAYLGLGMTAISYFVFNFALSRLPVVHIGLIAAAGPGVGTVAAAMIFQQTLEPIAFVGIGVVLLGSALPALHGLLRGGA